MKKLNPNWFFEDLLDFEYKKYVLLAYLQDVKHHFNQTKLYPQLAELVAHYRNLQQFNSAKNDLYNSFPERLTEVDLNKFKIAYTKAISNDELMDKLASIVDFSLPQIKEHLQEGREIYEFIEKEIVFEPVGILPLYKNEGYMIVHDGYRRDMNVYEYHLSFFENDEERFRSINTTYVTSYKKSFVNSTENIKIDLIRKFKKLPNPAIFSIKTELDYPLEETLLQIAKRMLVSFISV